MTAFQLTGGWIEVIAGVMFSGKSEELLRRVRRAIIARKRAGERTSIDPALVAIWKPRIEALFARLDRARDASVLPEEPENEQELTRWLIEVRRARFTAAAP